MIFEFVPNMYELYNNCQNYGEIRVYVRVIIFMKKHELGLGYCIVIIIGKFAVDFYFYFLFPIFFEKVMIFEYVPNMFIIP